MQQGKTSGTVPSIDSEVKGVCLSTNRIIAYVEIGCNIRRFVGATAAMDTDTVFISGARINGVQHESGCEGHLFRSPIEPAGQLTSVIS